MWDYASSDVIIPVEMNKFREISHENSSQILRIIQEFDMPSLMESDIQKSLDNSIGCVLNMTPTSGNNR